MSETRQLAAGLQVWRPSHPAHAGRMVHRWRRRGGGGGWDTEVYGGVHDGQPGNLLGPALATGRNAD